MQKNLRVLEFNEAISAKLLVKAVLINHTLFKSQSRIFQDLDYWSLKVYTMQICLSLSDRRIIIHLFHRKRSIHRFSKSIYPTLHSLAPPMTVASKISSIISIKRKCLIRVQNPVKKINHTNNPTYI